MNTLQLIKKQINKASAVHDAQITHTAYRGVKCEVRKAAQGVSRHLLLSRSYLHQMRQSWKHYKSQD